MLNLRYVSALCAVCCDCMVRNVFGFTDQVKPKLFIIHKFCGWFSNVFVSIRAALSVFRTLLPQSDLPFWRQTIFPLFPLRFSLRFICDNIIWLLQFSATNRSLHERKKHTQPFEFARTIVQNVNVYKFSGTDEQTSSKMNDVERLLKKKNPREKWYNKTTDHFLCYLREKIWNAIESLLNS